MDWDLQSCGELDFPRKSFSGPKITPELLGSQIPANSGKFREREGGGGEGWEGPGGLWVRHWGFRGWGCWTLGGDGGHWTLVVTGHW